LCGIQDQFLPCSHMAIDLDSRVQQGALDFAKSIVQNPNLPIFNISVTNVSSNSANLSWGTQGYTVSSVAYSVQPDVPVGSPTATDNLVSATHSLQLSNLVANTTYYIRITASGPGSNIQVSSPVIPFRTQPATLPVIRASNAAITLSGGLAHLTLTLTNIGAPGTGGQMVSASVGSIKTTVPLPLPIPDLGTGASFMPEIPFPQALGASGARAVATVTVQYNGVKYPLPVPVTLP
jgi:hypothetical protein